MSSSSQPRRYFDNAATSFPKPSGVAQAVYDYMTECGASAGRGAYREAMESGHIIEACRSAIRQLLNASPSDHVVFTLNGSDGLNMAIKGVVNPGDHVVTTAMEHNSVLRPLAEMAKRDGVEYTVVEVDPATTLVDPQAVIDAITPKTTLVAVNHASNVTGVLQPIEPIVDYCHTHNIPILVDAAQSAGHVPIDLQVMPIDLLSFPGHKALLGPLGTGVLMIRGGFEAKMRTYREGGTGSESEKAEQPTTMPDRFEAGSHNAAGIAGLLTGIRWLLDQGIGKIRTHEIELCGAMIEKLSQIEGLTWFGPRDPSKRVGVFSVRVEGFEPVELSGILEAQFGVLTRSGLHCAPLAHQTIGTDTVGGTTRFSMGPFITRDDVDAAIAGLSEISQSLRVTAADNTR